MYFNVYGKKYFFQQTGFSKVTITSTGIGVGTETPTFPLHITTYVASTQTYKFLNHGGIGGVGTYTNNYSIYCNNAICASEFDAISDQRIKTNIKNLGSAIDMEINIRHGLIAQEVENIIPSLVNYSYGVIDNIKTEFNINDINIYNDIVTLELNNLDIIQGDKLEISDIDNGINSNIRTVDIIEVSDNNFSFIDSKINTNKNLYISGKHVNDFHAIDYMGLIPILIKSIQELTERVNILESKLVI